MIVFLSEFIIIFFSSSIVYFALLIFPVISGLYLNIRVTGQDRDKWAMQVKAGLDITYRLQALKFGGERDC